MDLGHLGYCTLCDVASAAQKSGTDILSTLFLMRVHTL